jgi:opine dehydrogenase
MASLADQIGVNVPMIKTTIQLGNYLLGKDFYTNGRTMERLGLAGLRAKELIQALTAG